MADLALADLIRPHNRVQISSPQHSSSTLKHHESLGPQTLPGMNEEELQQALPRFHELSPQLARHSIVERSGSHIPCLVEQACSSDLLSSTSTHLQQVPQESTHSYKELEQAPELDPLWQQQPAAVQHCSDQPLSSLTDSSDQGVPSQSLQCPEHHNQASSGLAAQPGRQTVHMTGWHDDTGQQADTWVHAGRRQQPPSMLPISAIAAPVEGQAEESATPIAYNITRGVANSLQLTADQHQTSHVKVHHRDCLGPHDASQDIISAPVQQAQMLRRRTSFRHSMQGSKAQRVNAPPDSLTDPMQLHDQRQHLDTSFIHRPLPRSFSHKAVSPEDAPVRTFSNAEPPARRPTAALDHAVRRQRHGVAHIGMLHSNGQPQPKLSNQNRMLGRQALHNALQSTLVQAEACTLQLQMQQHEQRRMLQDLKVMNVLTAAMIAQTECAATS